MIPQAYLAGAIALAGFGAGWATNGWRLDSKVASCRADVTARDHALEIQGAAVTRLSAASESARAEAETARLAAEKAEGEAKVAEQKRRDAIASGKGGPATCSAAIAAQRAELVK